MLGPTSEERPASLPRRDASRAPRTLRADLHAHSCASAAPAHPLLQGLPESWSEPERLYDLARRRGMDAVALTDHDTIDGALALVERGFPDVIVGEEVTTRFADDGCVVHVLVWGLRPEEHEAIGALGLRDDAVALARWLRERGLPHAVAHPLAAQNNRLTRAHLERLALLFGGFETRSGAHAGGALVERFLAALTPEVFAQLAKKHALQPVHRPGRPWLRVGGSDDHALRSLGRTWTRCHVAASDGAASNARAILEALRAGRAQPEGAEGDERALRRQMRSVSLQGVRRARRALDDAGLRAGVPLAPLRAAAPISLLAHLHERKDEPLRRELAAALAGKPAPESPRAAQAADLRLAIFADAVEQPHGVSRFLTDLLAWARSAGLAHRVRVFCAPARPAAALPPGCVAIPVRCAIPAPAMPSLALGVPQPAALCDAVQTFAPTAVHISTPGPVGLAGLALAASLDLPWAATHHTDFPRYAQALLRSDAAAAIVRAALRRALDHCPLLLARSRPSADELIALGAHAGRLVTLPPAVDAKRFHPRFFDRKLRRDLAKDEPLALHVGRLGAEKNLDLLVDVWRRIEKLAAAKGLAPRLAVAGDGPLRSWLARRLPRARLLGVVRGVALSRLYASADLLLFPSTTETLGQVALEAQASATPPLVTDRGGPASIVRHGVDGLVLPADAPDRWAHEALALLTDAARRARLSRAARAAAAARSLDASYRVFFEAHAQLLTERRSAAPQAACPPR